MDLTPSLTTETYKKVETYLQKSISSGASFLFRTALFDKELRELSERFGVPPETLHSFVRNLHVTHVKKKSHPRVKAAIDSIVQEFVASPSPLSISTLAERHNFPPYLLMRLIVEHVTHLSSGKQVTAAIRSSGQEDGDNELHLLPQYRGRINLAEVIQEALVVDPLYGPRHDRRSYMVGIEYEVVLERKLKAMGISFETEEELRERGTARTPDVLLSFPLGIEVPTPEGGTEWRVICWIDSKALFGDVSTHKTSVLQQAESYVNRFGPGLILYWFGHAPTRNLGNSPDITVLGWDIPKTFRLPSGRMLSS